MVWSAVADNQAISFNTLKEACDALIFLQVGTIPPSGVSGTKMIKAGLIPGLVDVESAPLSGVPDNELVVKNQVVPVTRTYYRLSPCPTNPLGVAWTRIAPTLIGGTVNILNKRYILFGSTNRYWTWDGTSVGPQTTIPSGYNGSIQKIDDTIGCP